MSGDTDWVELERAKDQGHERAAGKIRVNLTSGLTMTYDVREDRSTIWAPGDSQAIATVKGEPGKTHAKSPGAVKMGPGAIAAIRRGPDQCGRPREGPGGDVTHLVGIGLMLF